MLIWTSKGLFCWDGGPWGFHPTFYLKCQLEPDEDDENPDGKIVTIVQKQQAISNIGLLGYWLP